MVRATTENAVCVQQFCMFVTLTHLAGEVDLDCLRFVWI